MPREDRTEKATPKHRQRAREKGQVARSLMGPRIVAAGAAMFRLAFGQMAQPNHATSAAGLDDLLRSAVATVGLAIAPVAGVCLLAGLVAGVGQVGFKPSVQTLKPDFRRINPVSGLKNLLGPNAVFEAIKTVVKVGVVAAVAALALLPGPTGLASVVGISAGGLAALSVGKAFGVAEDAAFAYVLIGIVDYAWKRHRHEQQLKMTKQEVKDENRQYGVSAEVKAAQRRRHMQAAGA